MEKKKENIEEKMAKMVEKTVTGMIGAVEKEIEKGIEEDIKETKEANTPDFFDSQEFKDFVPEIKKTFETPEDFVRLIKNIKMMKEAPAAGIGMILEKPEGVNLGDLFSSPLSDNINDVFHSQGALSCYKGKEDTEKEKLEEELLDSIKHNIGKGRKKYPIDLPSGLSHLVDIACSLEDIGDNAFFAKIVEKYMKKQYPRYSYKYDLENKKWNIERLLLKEDPISSS